MMESRNVLPTSLPWLGIAPLRRAILSREVSPVAVTEQALTRAGGVGRELNAFITLDAEGALQAARRAEASLSGSKGNRSAGPLFGIPVTIKDLMGVRGVRTRGGSRALDPRRGPRGEPTPQDLDPPLPDGFSGDRDAPVVRRLRAAGAIVLGTTNLNEFAYGITGENAHFGDVVNPWNRGFMPGGSSAGSAAALAAGIGYGSVGTDTRGSIRIPASCCGLAGFKPTRRLISTRGVFPLSWTLDHVGPMARSVDDLILLTRVMAGPRLGLEPAVSPCEAGAGLRVGIPSFFLRDLDPTVEALVRGALGLFETMGMGLVPLDIPELDDALSASAVIAASEALAVHDLRIRARRGHFGAAMLERLEGGYALSALDLVRARRVRAALAAAYRTAFRTVDLMAGPTLPGLPAPVGSAVMRVGEGREEAIVPASCRLVAPQNMTGTPALSVPCGLSEEGLPVGLQIWGPLGSDALVLSAGLGYERQSGRHLSHAPVD